MPENNAYTEPQVDSDISVGGESETSVTSPQNEIRIPIKFNKETKNLTAEEAAILAQKGMKFEMIENDFEKLRNLASKAQMSVPEYITSLQNMQAQNRRAEILAECQGNEALADRVLELENLKTEDDGLDELREYFPTVKSLDDLPRAVVESARLKGENLLNAYLKFRFLKKRQKDDENMFMKAANQASVGSLKNPEGNADDTFIKALWGR